VTARARVVPVVPTYGPRRTAAFHALWTALTRSARPGAPGLADRLKALPEMVSAALRGDYADLSRGRLLLFLLALGYLASPVDLVPEAFLGLIGLTDDAVVALWLGGAFLSETERFIDWKRSRPLVVDQPPND
jgi:uncharacterized membrane protein YkvA (DUF1232 family)